MKRLGVMDFVTSKEAGKLYGKHELTICRIIKRHFAEGIEYRKIEDREQLLIRKDCLESYFNNPNDFNGKRAPYERKELPDRFYRI